MPLFVVLLKDYVLKVYYYCVVSAYLYIPFAFGKNT